MIEKIIGAMQDAMKSDKETFFELKQYDKEIYFISRDLKSHIPNYQMKLDYTDKNELCDLIYFAIISEVVPDPAVNFIEHLCCGFGDTIHTDLFMELNENVAFCILDQDCDFQDWILAMKNNDEPKQEKSL